MTVEEEYVGRLFAGGSSEFLMARTVMLPAGSVSIPVIESAGPTAEYFADSCGSGRGREWTVVFQNSRSDAASSKR